MNWLSQLIYWLSTTTNTKNMSGYVYIFDACTNITPKRYKIGYTSLYSLSHRVATYRIYHPEGSFTFIYSCSNASRVEKYVKEQFTNLRVINALAKKSEWIVSPLNDIILSVINASRKLEPDRDFSSIIDNPHQPSDIVTIPGTLGTTITSSNIVEKDVKYDKLEQTSLILASEHNKRIKNPRGYYYEFIIKDKDLDVELIIGKCKREAIHWCIQEETNNENETYYRGRIGLLYKRTLLGLKRYFVPIKAEILQLNGNLIHQLPANGVVRGPWSNKNPYIKPSSTV